MKQITIRTHLEADNEAEKVEIRVTQGPVLIRSAEAPAHDAAASFDLDDGDYVAHARVLPDGAEVSQAFAPDGQTIELEVQ
jgi:hypothetical protein